MVLSGKLGRPAPVSFALGLRFSALSDQYPICQRMSQNNNHEVNMQRARTVKSGASVLMSLLLCACASGPTAVQMEGANYGRDMAPEECVKITETLIANTMKDPGSAQFKHSQCHKGYWNSVPLLGMPVAFGWFQAGEVNGKNSFGGYVGFRPYQVLLKDGEVIRYCIANKDGICVPSGK